MWEDEDECVCVCEVGDEEEEGKKEDEEEEDKAEEEDKEDKEDKEWKYLMKLEASSPVASGEKIACDVDKVLWPDPAQRQEEAHWWHVDSFDFCPFYCSSVYCSRPTVHCRLYNVQ